MAGVTKLSPQPTAGELTPGSPAGRRHALCPLAALPAGDERDGREFRIVVRDRTLSLFVVRANAGVRAYLNRCPHRGTPLNWVPDRFLTDDREHAICATHGALFRIDDGRCIAGPCVGDSLEPICVVVDGGVVVVPEDALPDVGE
jgi:nitrite reductase/ring-hydroxylating ferredoxin subunit